MDPNARKVKAMCGFKWWQVVEARQLGVSTLRAAFDTTKSCELVTMKYLRATSHGVPSPTHVNKPQHGGKFSGFEPRETIKVLVILYKRISGFVLQERYSSGAF